MFDMGTDEQEAMLYFLYMMSDGEVSYSEEKLFDEICRELDLNEDGKQTAVTKCKELAKDSKAAFDVIVRGKPDELIDCMLDDEGSFNMIERFDEKCEELDQGEEDDFYAVLAKVGEITKAAQATLDVMRKETYHQKFGLTLEFDLKNASSKARIIWNLINLGYADTCFSDEEKKIVEYLVEKWEVNREVYQEMIDTADTMLALTKQKEWLISNFSKDRERDEREKKIDTEIRTMLADIKLTIEELM